MDEKLRHILNAKLENYESSVPQHLWEKVSAKTPVAKGGMSVMAKWVITTIAAASAVGASLFFAGKQDKNPEKTIVNQEAVTKQDAPISAKNDNMEIGTVTQAKPTGTNSIIQKPISTEIAQTDNPSITGTSDLEQMKATGPAERKQGNTEQVNPTVNTSPELTHSTEKPAYAFTAVPVKSRELTYFFMPVNPDAKSYNWNFGDDEMSREMTPMHTYEEPGVYDVILETTTDRGLEQVMISVECLPEPQWFVPSIFTPNGDGKNDLFDLMTLSKYVQPVELIIFNSAGQVVFTSQNAASWDGLNSQGTEAPEGNYLFKLLATNLRHLNVEKSGFIYLQR